VNVTRLISISGVEKEPVRAEPSDRWHVVIEYTPPVGTDRRSRGGVRFPFDGVSGPRAEGAAGQLPRILLDGNA
jgi:hypothetical protein